MIDERPDTPGNVAYFFFRSLARFYGSVFFPFFRVWGETDCQQNKGKVFVARNFGLLTWLCALRVFRHPVRFVVADEKDSSWCFKAALAGGMAPLRLTMDADADFQKIQALSSSENLFLLIPQNPDSYTEDLITRLKNKSGLHLLFMAISGATKALPPGSFIPRAYPVSVFCGLPHIFAGARKDPCCELDFLEKALREVPLGELPSIFFNHPRNLEDPSR